MKKELKSKLASVGMIIGPTLFIASVVLLVKTNTPKETVPFQTPFVIVGKKPQATRLPGNDCMYKFADATGRVESFHDSVGAYSVGDTIK